MVSGHFGSDVNIPPSYDCSSYRRPLSASEQVHLLVHHCGEGLGPRCLPCWNKRQQREKNFAAVFKTTTRNLYLQFPTIYPTVSRVGFEELKIYEAMYSIGLCWIDNEETEVTEFAVVEIFSLGFGNSLLKGGGGSPTNQRVSLQARSGLVHGFFQALHLQRGHSYPRSD